jgi:glucokinase
MKVDPKGNKAAILATWVACIKATISFSPSTIKGIGVAVPGPFDYYEGISLIKGVDKYDSIYGLDIRHELAGEFDLNPSEVRFINDAAAFSIAECRVGLAKNYSRCVALTLGTGLGSCFVKNGVPVFDGDQIPEGGFLYNKPVNGGIADDQFSTRGLINLYKNQSGRTVTNAYEIFLLAAYDPDAKKTLALCEI